MISSLHTIYERGLKALLYAESMLVLFSPNPCMADADFLEGEPSFEEIVEIATLPTRQIVFGYDRDRDGTVDFRVYRAVLEFVARGSPCADPDPRYLRVPRDGFYRIEKTPAANLTQDAFEPHNNEASPSGIPENLRR